MHVVVVDDEPEIREVMTSALEEAGYSVTAAADGERALDAIAERRPDVVLLDLHLPGMTGWQLQSWLRALDPQIPVVFVTASDRARAEAEAHGAAGYLGKPFALDDLLGCVEQVAGSGAPPAATYLDAATRATLGMRLHYGHLYARRAAQAIESGQVGIEDTVRYLEIALACLSYARDHLTSALAPDPPVAGAGSGTGGGRVSADEAERAPS